MPMLSMMLTTEGIYVRNIKTGAVETVIGRTYLLGPEEELWEKQLSSDVERLLSFPQNDSKGMKLHENMDFVPEKRDKTKAGSNICFLKSCSIILNPKP